MAARRAAVGWGYARLEGRLSLVAWLHRQLGYAGTEELLTDLKGVREGFDDSGRSYIVRHLAARARPPLLAWERLHSYDDNVRRHWRAINAGRPLPLTLRYFQYLAALYAEIYLDRWFESAEGLCRELNVLVAEHNAAAARAEQWPLYAVGDLSKLAFWMATGGGKTLLLHLNYRQYLHYRRQYRPGVGERPRNILLLTPNEGLSRQHLEDFRPSSIAAARFDPRGDGGFMADRAPVRVTEITKLTLEQEGRGQMAPVEAFGADNLIFVDEGHKGAGSAARVWKSVRDALGATGFTFEYSATFGQALAAANSPDLWDEYGKAIAFDYSYRHFYNDGYGKDFHILNLPQETTAETTDGLLLANLLSFYQQLRYYADNKAALLGYNLERPLWLGVGGSVAAGGGSRGEQEFRSDVLTVCRFLHRVLSQPEWATLNIDQLLQGRSGFAHPDSGEDLFAERFSWLAARRGTAAAVYQDLLELTLGVSHPGGLVIRGLPGNTGELGLKAAGAADYFGVIYIGDAARFKALAAEQGGGIALEEDYVSRRSLFQEINRPDRPLNLLLGSRRFMEGWNSWRVANMGLLNIGQSEGSQIIQLFGRGIRLRGRERSLQRSSAANAPPGGHPPDLRLLETLNIFALRANYMGKFREYLDNEGIVAGAEVAIPIRPNREFLGRGLVLPRRPEPAPDFATAEMVEFEYRPDLVAGPVLVDWSATVQELRSQPGAGPAATAYAGPAVDLPPESLELVDWAALHRNLLEYAERKGYRNLVIAQPSLRPLLAAHQPPDRVVYRLEAAAGWARPRSWAERLQLQAAVAAILQKYADALYRQARTRWESRQLVYRPLEEGDANLQFNATAGGGGQYRARVSGAEGAELLREIEGLLAAGQALYAGEAAEPAALPRIHFDRHLYQPLLLESGGKVSLSPPGLNAGERDFVRDLRDFRQGEGGPLPADTEVFLLRNLSRGRGVGFYDDGGFFPDFILWVKTGNRQRIVFIEPHGMRHAKAYQYDEKAQLHARLPAMAADIAQRSGGQPAVELDAFLISTTPYPELRLHYENGSWDREDFAAKHILFPERNAEYDYLERILGTAGGGKAAASFGA